MTSAQLLAQSLPLAADFIDAAFLARIVIDYAVARTEDNSSDNDLHTALTDADFEIIADRMAEHYDADDRPAFVLLQEFSASDRALIRALADKIYSAQMLTYLAQIA